MEGELISLNSAIKLQECDEGPKYEVKKKKKVSFFNEADNHASRMTRDKTNDFCQESQKNINDADSFSISDISEICV